MPTETERIDRRIKGMGRSLSPTYTPGTIHTYNRAQQFNEMSRQSLARINAKYGKPFRPPIQQTVSSHLELHESFTKPL